jgi:hypothetical protein
MNYKKKTGRDGISRAAQKDSHEIDVTPFRARVAAAIGRASFRTLLTRWARSE